MTPEQLTQLATTFGPVGAIGLYALSQWIKGRAETLKDPISDKLDAIIAAQSAMATRLAVVETILEERKK